MISELQIQAALRGKKTFLKNCYFTTPLKVANITEDKSNNSLRLMLMSSSPGILDRDEYQVKIELEEGCSLQLQTQSYQRLFNMKKCASQRMEVFMSKNASFCFLPHPTVPHKNSNFRAINKVWLSNGCELIWGEVLACGRKLCGEEFQFIRYQSITEIFLNGKLAVKENLVVKPFINNVRAIGQFEDYTHQASLLYLNETADINQLIKNLNQELSVHENVCFGVSALAVSGLIVRLLGCKAEQLYNCLNRITDFFLTKEADNISTNIRGEKRAVHAN